MLSATTTPPTDPAYRDAQIALLNNITFYSESADGTRDTFLHGNPYKSALLNDPLITAAWDSQVSLSGTYRSVAARAAAVSTGVMAAAIFHFIRLVIHSSNNTQYREYAGYSSTMDRDYFKQCYSAYPAKWTNYTRAFPLRALGTYGASSLFTLFLAGFLAVNIPLANNNLTKAITAYVDGTASLEAFTSALRGRLLFDAATWAVGTTGTLFSLPAVPADIYQGYARS